MKLRYSLLLSFVLITVALHAQEIIEPGGKSLNTAYFKPRVLFQKLTWLDKDGKIVGLATLNCITRIDSVNKKLIYFQIRNDGKKDSTIAEWPTLEPIYTSETSSTGKLVFDHHKKDSVAYFDDFLSDYMIGALPLKPGYKAKFVVCSDHKSVVTIKDVFTDVLPSGNAQPIEVWLVQANFAGFEVLYWIDKTSGDMLKSLFQFQDGSMFMKSKI